MSNRCSTVCCDIQLSAKPAVCNYGTCLFPWRQAASQFASRRPKLPKDCFCWRNSLFGGDATSRPHKTVKPLKPVPFQDEASKMTKRRRFAESSALALDGEKLLKSGLAAKQQSVATTPSRSKRKPANADSLVQPLAKKRQKIRLSTRCAEWQNLRFQRRMNT